MGTFVLIRPAQTFYERIILGFPHTRTVSAAFEGLVSFKNQTSPAGTDVASAPIGAVVAVHVTDGDLFSGGTTTVTVKSDSDSGGITITLFPTIGAATSTFSGDFLLTTTTDAGADPPKLKAAAGDVVSAEYLDTSTDFGTVVFVDTLTVSEQATVITVDTTADSVANDGQCSLREAITAANTDTASGVSVGECTGGSGDDTITLALDTYQLSLSGGGEDANSTGDLDVTKSLRIEYTGPAGARPIIDGGSFDRVFHVLQGQLDLSRIVVQRRYPQKVCKQSGGVPSV